MFEKSCQFQVHRTWYRLHPSSPKAEVSTYSTEFDGSQDFSNTLLPTSFLRPEVQSWQPLHDMVLVVRRCRSCAAFLPGRSSLFHAYSFAARPPHRCHTNPKPYHTLINQSSQRLQRGCTASPWTRAVHSDHPRTSPGCRMGRLA